MLSKVSFWVKANKWLIAGLVIAVLNPVPSGVILGIVMLTEEKLKKNGQIVVGVAIIALIVTTLLVFLSPKR